MCIQGKLGEFLKGCDIMLKLEDWIATEMNCAAKSHFNIRGGAERGYTLLILYQEVLIVLWEMYHENVHLFIGPVCI